MVSGSMKGADFERLIARELSLWLSEGDDPYVFSRRPLSGGSVRDKTGKSLSSGDIFADKPLGRCLTDKISFELKTVRDLYLPLWRHLDGSSHKVIRDFIAQSEEAAAPYDRYWAVIMKTLRCKPLFLTNYPLFQPKYNILVKNSWPVWSLDEFMTPEVRDHFLGESTHGV